jgi:hypothetical protein
VNPRRRSPRREIAKKIENPIGDLISVPFNNYATFNYGPNGQSRGTFNLLEIQPVIPIHLTPDWNLITRTVLPLVWTPDLSPVPSVAFGTAPTDFSAFLTPKNPTNGWLWGVGPVVQIPTISNADLGSNVWGGGPTAIIVHEGEKIVAGALANAIWSFGGTHGPLGNAYNTTLIEPFFNYNFGEGWFFYGDPNINVNWQAKGTKWTVPLGGGIAKIIKIEGKLPVKLSAGLFYNAVQPTYGGRLVLNTALALIFWRPSSVGWLDLEVFVMQTDVWTRPWARFFLGACAALGLIASAPAFAETISGQVSTSRRSDRRFDRDALGGGGRAAAATRAGSDGCGRPLRGERRWQWRRSLSGRRRRATGDTDKGGRWARADGGVGRQAAAHCRRQRTDDGRLGVHGCAVHQG